MLTHESPEIQTFLTAWHENGRAEFEHDYTRLVYDEYAPKIAKTRTKYIALNRDTAGVFLVDRLTHAVYSIKGYGVPNRCVGTLESLTRVYAEATHAIGSPGYVGTDAALREAASHA